MPSNESTQHLTALLTTHMLIQFMSNRPTQHWPSLLLRPVE